MTTEKLVYRPIPEMGRDEIESVMLAGDPEKMGLAALSAALYSGDGPWAETICFSLAKHPSPQARANAFTALGHIARLRGTMDWDTAIEVLTAGLADENDFARGSANDSLEDVVHFRELSKASRRDDR